MNIAVVGLGLIGGSIARAFKEKTGHMVYGWNRTQQILCKAKLVGAVDGPLTDDRLAECDAVFIALYPQTTIRWLTEHAPLIKKGALVFDTCGVKQPVCAPCFALAKEYGFDFIGAHPMAGVEHAGFDSSTGSMFEGASMILVPPTGMAIETVAKAKALSLELDFERVVITDAAEHDRMIAYTSQMAHVVSSAYVQSPCSLRHRGFSAGSYRDMTRVACLQEDMWTELFLDNSEPLSAELGELIGRLQRFHDAIASKDAETLHEMLRAGRVRKEEADGKVL